MKPALRVLAAILALCTPTLAETACPPTPDTTAERSRLMAELKIAPDEETGRAIEDAIWRQWIKAPDSRAQDLLDRGMQRRDAYDFEAAEQLFDELVAYCPHYPEGYNQRAFIRFLRERYDAALEDLDKVLEMRPDHFAALSGKGLVFFRQGRVELSQKALREAVRLHPWLKERHMVIKPKGEEL